jgi:hypothetical protein
MLCHSVSCGECDACCVTRSVVVSAMHVCHSVSCGEGDACCVTRSVVVSAMPVCHSVSCGECDACSNTNVWFLTKNTFSESATLRKLYLPCQNMLYFDELSHIPDSTVLG